MKTGRDVVVAALLGAEEFGFATAPLVVSGCIMMRVCHLDTCPVGVATQNPKLRAKFNGKADYVVNFFEFVAQEVREYLAELGLRSVAEAVGHAELLDTRKAVDHWKAGGLDLSPIFHVPEIEESAARHCVTAQDHGLDKALDNTLIQLAEGALDEGKPVRLELPVRNVNRTVGTMLGHELTKRWGGEGLPDGTIDVTFTGTAGQSFGAFVPRGITLRLVGDANDYLGKGLSGGRIVVRPHPDAQFTAEEHLIAGNVIAYGATGGEIFLRGKVGERFGVRNSGATAVVEGVGDHGCEYMTGGRVVVLGGIGRNFAAGMSGGIAYVLDLAEKSRRRVNTEMVDLDPLDDADREFLREMVRRHYDETQSETARALLVDFDTAVERFGKLIERLGGTGPFEHGLYASSEMLVDGFLELYRSGILKRKVYGHAGLQRLLNDGRIGEEVTPAMLETLIEVRVISSNLTSQDFTLLQQFGILRPELNYEDGSIQLGDGARISVPLGLTTGHSFRGEGAVFTPYVTPRVMFDAFSGDDRARSTALALAVDIGLDLDLLRDFKIRFGASVGDRDALAVGRSC
jgi:glutamate synthase domain-containing protein 3